ncbi:protein LURP-one-related 7-like [Bidens hawaiensis]|uniref:protein LURP-one-related 7-like n=1 Tax=Bidens hawaiensis TaxID=980011 RepID=UPI004049D786
MEQGSYNNNYEPNSDGVPIDLFVSKKLKFTDSSSNLVFSVHRPTSSKSNPLHSIKRLLSDSSGNPLISISHSQKGSWEGFSCEESDPMFKVERTTNTLTRVEFQVFLNNGNNNKNSDFKMRGSPFFRSCTIYKGDSIVAQTSLMYKLGIQNVVVPRNRFRLTIFPGYADHAFIVALTVIFFYGRKLWI